MKIQLSRIHPNPHRNLDRNPVRNRSGNLLPQAKTVLESIQRNEWGENVIVRPYPGNKGHYQLAYGHNRVEALRELGYKSAEFIVKEIDDWGMYTWMVDENESQREVTPQLIYENIESGINYLEPVIRECETLKEFRSMVPTGIDEGSRSESNYQQVRNNVLSGEGLGVSFLARELPGEKSTRRDNVQAVVDSHYEKTKAAAKDKRAKAKEHEAVAKRNKAKAQKSAAKAAKLKKEADKLEQEAAKLTAEAKNLRNTGVSQSILLGFDSARKMTTFAQSVKVLGIPKAHHKAAFDEHRNVSSDHMRDKLNAWWFVRSGKAQKQREQAKREGWKHKHRSKSLDEFSQELTVKLRSINKEINAVTPYTDAIQGKRIRDNLLAQCNTVWKSVGDLAEALESEQEEVTVAEAQKLLKAS